MLFQFVLPIGRVVFFYFISRTMATETQHHVKVLLDINNTVIEKRWKVVKRIAEGSFDSIYYEVLDTWNKPNAYTIKVESNLPVKSDNPPHFLPDEVTLLTTLKSASAAHFPGFEAKGEFGQVRYVIIGAIGKSMDAIRHQMPRQRFHLRTVIHIGKEILRCLEDIHNARFVHRDVKPHNMVLGKPPKHQRNVYLVNFELSRKYVDDKGELLLPRSKTLYRGTPRYSSVSALRYQEQGRVDDMWAWLFSLLEMTLGKVPIDDESGPHETEKFIPWLAEQKQKAIDDPKIFLAHAPPEYRQIFDHISQLGFHDKPDYVECMKVLEEMARSKNYTEDMVLDWETPQMKAFVA